VCFTSLSSSSSLLDEVFASISFRAGFERNDGGDDGQQVTVATLSRAPRGGIDHLGMCIANLHRALEWYAKLGFTTKVMMYEPDPVNPLQKF
jgi:hypothetical protein